LGGSFNHYLILLEKMGSIPKSTGLFSLPKKNNKNLERRYPHGSEKPFSKTPVNSHHRWGWLGEVQILKFSM
jgi:hypothetical protein